jgi:hypothetical protein
VKAGPGAPKPLAKPAALLAAAVVLAGSWQLARPGYSVDEEFTVFAVRGIEAHGLPLLPSGLLYDRGIAYSYAASLAKALSGAELPAFRAVSLLSAALCVLLAFFLVRRIASDQAAVVASALLLVPVPFWATATSARFYAPFLGASLLTLYFLTHRHWWLGLIAAAALARLTHELAFTLALVPAVCWLLNRDQRRRWTYAVLSTAAGLLIGQLILFALHALEPSSGDTMVRRFFLWQVLNLFERPGDRQFMIPIVVMVMAWLIAPRRQWWWTVSALSVSALILSYSLAVASNSAPLSIELVKAVLIEGSRYPLDMFWHIAGATPLTMILALAGLAARRHWIHGWWIGWVVWFGVIESGITTNYLLLPAAFMMIAIAVDVSASFSGRQLAGVAAAAALALGIDQWRDTSLETARPTIQAEGVDDIRAALQPNDRVACTDELGCLMTVGRIDRWLALDDFVRERFLVRRADGAETGVYTGVPAAFRPGDLFSPNADGALPDRVLIVDIFKEFPIGNSRSWLPRAIEQDGLQVIPLLETPQLRVLQVSPPEAVARK